MHALALNPTDARNFIPAPQRPGYEDCCAAPRVELPNEPIKIFSLTTDLRAFACARIERAGLT